MSQLKAIVHACKRRNKNEIWQGRARQVLQKQLINVVMKDGMLTSGGYTDDYYYGLSANPYAVTATSENPVFQWDKAGNMTFMRDKSDTKLFFWTEDNRMQALITDHAAAFYRYDASGERELKLLATTRDLNVNGRNYKQPVYDDAVLYASGGLMTVDAAGYKKHYFMEGERILTSIGGGGSANIQPNEELRSVSGETIKDISIKYFDGYVQHYFIEHKNNAIGNPLEIPGDLKIVPDLQSKFTNSVNQSVSDIPYYYVPDYLSSGSVITNSIGDPVHVLSYIPFGEILLDLSTGFETPYKFAGYEHDQESGLSYASARYYAGMSRYPIFLSVDPLAEKYPWISPYAYCFNNPVNFIDPDGNNPIDPRTGKEISMNLYCAAVYNDYNRKKITPVLDKSLYESAKPYNAYTQRKFNKPDGLWDGVSYNGRGYNLSHLSSGAFAALSTLFPDNPYIDAAYGTPSDYLWMRMAEQGSYIFLDNTWDKSLWLHSTTKSFNIITVAENRITQIVNLARGSGKEQYNINSITTFDIVAGDIQSREKRTWWGGPKTEQYRTLNVAETIQNYQNNEPNGTRTVKTYQTEEIVK